MQMDLAWDVLQETIAGFGGPDSVDTKMHIDLSGRDPDDGMTEIPYEKGAVFLRTIEAAVGRQRWDEYQRGYFDRFAFRSLTAADFLADLREHLVMGDAALEERLGLDEWVYGPGLPGNAVHRRSTVLERIDQEAAAFAAGNRLSGDPSKWSTPERVRFLNRLPRELSADRLLELREVLGLDSQNNSEVTFAWLRLAIANRYDAAIPQLEHFLTSMGRRKFVLPLFTALWEQEEWGRPLATRIHAAARPGYHSVTSGRVDTVVQASPAAGP
jgi:leukotriene-A4 hydrolase